MRLAGRRDDIAAVSPGPALRILAPDKQRLLASRSDKHPGEQELDKFQSMQRRVMLMSPRERASDMDVKTAGCICAKCPSYTDDNRERRHAVFCAKGRPQYSDMANQGCICHDCPVASEMGLTRLSFCIKGSERDQRGM